jgi:hypothetical protein
MTMTERDDGVQHGADRIMRAEMLDTAMRMGTAPVEVAVGSPLREAIDTWKAGRTPRICPHYLDPFWFVALPNPGIRCRACMIAALEVGDAGARCCAACREPVPAEGAYVDQAVEDGTWLIARFCRGCYEGSGS